MDPVDPLEVASKLFRDQPPGFPFENFDLEELILPDDDDMGIKSDDGEDEEEELETETGFGSVIGASSIGLLQLLLPWQRGYGAEAAAHMVRSWQQHLRYRACPAAALHRSRGQPARRARGQARKAHQRAAQDLRPNRHCP